MIDADFFKDRTVAVFGLGMTGLSSARALIAGGAQVAAWDDSEQGRSKAEKAGVPLADLRSQDWSQIEALVLAPGVPLTHPEPHWVVRQAQKNDVEIIGDTELFFRAHAELQSKAKVVAVTGTNGKSTTAALIAHILRSSGRSVELGGNIGRAVLDLEPFADDKIYVIEFSSFQIDLTPSLRSDVAVLLNVTPDHLDRHGTFEIYAKVKAHIFSRLAPDGLAVIAVDDETTRGIAGEFADKVEIERVSCERTLTDGVCGVSGGVAEMRNGQAATQLSLDGVAALRGEHNRQNAAAAFAVARKLGLRDREIEQGMRSFPGLAHRMEVVGRLNNVDFINDSKATNADAAAKALASFGEIYWIAGGRAKAGGIADLVPYFARIEKAFLIGESAAAFAQTLDGRLGYEVCGTVEAAVAAAARQATKSDGAEPVVLFSPAAASYDQFANFVERGEAFRKAVAALAGTTMREKEGYALKPVGQ